MSSSWIIELNYSALYKCALIAKIDNCTSLNLKVIIDLFWGRVLWETELSHHTWIYLLSYYILGHVWKMYENLLKTCS